ncbi:unnamed protein product [Calypogeia fissa]
MLAKGSHAQAIGFHQSTYLHVGTKRSRTNWWSSVQLAPLQISGHSIFIKLTEDRPVANILKIHYPPRFSSRFTNICIVDPKVLDEEVDGLLSGKVNTFFAVRRTFSKKYRMELEVQPSI